MTVKIVIARSGATKQSMLPYGERWIAAVMGVRATRSLAMTG